jgi:hypothetical protein
MLIVLGPRVTYLTELLLIHIRNTDRRHCGLKFQVLRPEYISQELLSVSIEGGK